MPRPCSAPRGSWTSRHTTSKTSRPCSRPCRRTGRRRITGSPAQSAARRNRGARALRRSVLGRPLGPDALGPARPPSSGRGIDPSNTRHEPHRVDRTRRNGWSTRSRRSGTHTPDSPQQLARVRYEDVPPRLLFGRGRVRRDRRRGAPEAYAHRGPGDARLERVRPTLHRVHRRVVLRVHQPPDHGPDQDPRYKQTDLVRARPLGGHQRRRVDRHRAIAPTPSSPRSARTTERRPGAISPTGPRGCQITRGPARADRGEQPRAQSAADMRPTTPRSRRSATPIPRATWPWPKFIRVTMSLADPTDPTIEETFRMVVRDPRRLGQKLRRRHDTPGDGAPRSTARRHAGNDTTGARPGPTPGQGVRHA